MPVDAAFLLCSIYRGIISRAFRIGKKMHFSSLVSSSSESSCEFFRIKEIICSSYIIDLLQYRESY